MCKQKMIQIATDRCAMDKDLHLFLLTTEQVQLLDEILRHDILDDPHKWENNIHLKALYTRVQNVLKDI